MLCTTVYGSHRVLGCYQMNKGRKNEVIDHRGCRGGKAGERERGPHTQWHVQTKRRGGAVRYANTATVRRQEAQDTVME
jgi:hypothetical protein